VVNESGGFGGTSTRPNPTIYDPASGYRPGGASPTPPVGSDATSVLPLPAPDSGPPPGYGPPGGYGPPPGYPPAQPPGYPPGPGYSPAPGAPPGAPGPYGPPPAPAKKGNGCLKAFAIVSVIVLVIGIGGTVALVYGANRWWQSTVGTARTSDYQIDTSAFTCSITPGRLMKATGNFTNKKDQAQAYRISIDFTEGSNGPKLGDAIAFTGTLNAGETKPFDANAVATRQPTAVRCKITDVSYFVA
jgi:hypothetical protein